MPRPKIRPLSLRVRLYWQAGTVLGNLSDLCTSTADHLAQVAEHLETACDALLLRGSTHQLRLIREQAPSPAPVAPALLAAAHQRGEHVLLRAGCLPCVQRAQRESTSAPRTHVHQAEGQELLPWQPSAS